MNIHIIKKQVIDQLLSPISRITEECSLQITKDSISALVNDTSGSTILYCKINTANPLLADSIISLNIKDVKKLTRVLDCITNEEFDIILDDKSSTLAYKSPTLSFKMHLVTDNVIRKSAISLDKIISLKFDSDFVVGFDKLTEILRGSIFTTDTNKIYFFTKDGAVYSELTDKAAQDLDSITFNVTTSFNGREITTPLPFNLDILKIISSLKLDSITVKVNNTYKILMFEIANSGVLYKYIIPAYTK